MASLHCAAAAKLVAPCRLGRPFAAQRHPFVAGPCRQRTAAARRVVAAATQQPQSAAPTTAKGAVESGLARFEAGDAQGALALFLRAQELGPDGDEMRAALYNAACAQTRLKQWQPAVDSVLRAVNDYELKLVVALRDKDLEPLRERREWLAALASLRGGITEEQYVNLRAEAKAPFRLPRTIFFGGLAVGAAVGLIIITGRLLAALKGGEGAPALAETAQNFGINAAALGALSFLLWRDSRKTESDKQVVSREEALARLQVSLGDRTVPLAAFRGTTRPVILAGSKGQVAKALAAAEPYYAELRERGVSIIPIELSNTDPAEQLRRLKAEFGSEEGAAAAAGGQQPKGFGSSAAAPPKQSAAGSSATGLGKQDRKWQLEAADKQEWVQWLAQQRKEAGISGDAVYVQVQLDGSVRASGTGSPPWQQFLGDIPELSSVRTKFTDGAGTNF